MNFPQNLRALRQSNKITQKSLANTLGVSERAVRFWESGEREPNFTQAIAIADVFNVSLDELIGRVKC